jgi:hypothetical protein
MIVAIKAAAVTIEVALTSVLASQAPSDEFATRIALYAAALTGAGYLFKNVVRPVVKVLHRMAEAVEALEDLPAWRRRTDARVNRTNRRLRHVELGLGQIGSGQMAILRELGIEDSVRRQFSDPIDFERWLESEADGDEDELEV